MDLYGITDSGYFLAGWSGSPGEIAHFIKTNSAGDTLWTRSFTQMRIYGGAQAGDGNYIAVGTAWDSQFDYRVCQIKTDANGNTACQHGTTSFIVSNPLLQNVTTNTVMIYTNTMVHSAHFQVGTLSNQIDICSSIAVIELSRTISELSSHLSTQILSLTFSSLQSTNLRLAVQDITGRTLYQTQLTTTTGINKKEIQVGDLAKGIYIVTLSGEEGSESPPKDGFTWGNVKVVKE